MSGNSEPDGTRCSGGARPLTCPATCCFGFWLIGYKPIGSVNWMPTAGVCLTGSGRGSSDGINRLVAGFNRPRTELRPGALLTREWDGHLQRVMVLADGFSWNGKTYASLSMVAFAMTGTRWSGPRFFGLDKPSSEVRP
jgi:hypothetical protein